VPRVERSARERGHQDLRAGIGVDVANDCMDGRPPVITSCVLESLDGKAWLQIGIADEQFSGRCRRTDMYVVLFAASVEVREGFSAPGGDRNVMLPAAARVDRTICVVLMSVDRALRSREPRA